MHNKVLEHHSAYLLFKFFHPHFLSCVSCVRLLGVSPSSRLFAVGAGAGYSAEPLAFTTRRLHVIISHLNTQVVQVAGVQCGVSAQLPLLRVRLLLYLDT